MRVKVTEKILVKVTGRNKLLEASSKPVLNSSKLSLGGQSKWWVKVTRKWKLGLLEKMI